ncbi:MAG: membrane or secreted protein [Saprospiraceae bacterium]|nr:membrane or secreted protein [Saprospiraceae bacterium]
MRLVSFFCLFVCLHLNGQSALRNVIVDNQGVMRWEDSKSEVKGFGVNYTVPFAHAYRSAKKLGIDPLKAIDEDVYHFSRLGFDLYRVHVWDTEISDTLGNLIFNEHLNAFDYLLKKLADRNINYVITPIAFWGNGWPEPDEPTPGFSAKYGKDNCLTDPGAIKAQERYLFQFMNHINPYTGLAYKDDPRLVAIEISNEPHHREAPEKVTAFIRRMVEAVKKTGCKKPVFYNISHSVHLADAYFKAGIQGGTFQWYPTGLGYQQELSGNLLPNVDDYHITFDATIKQYKGAKLVYEFDAADVGKSYMYPAMARSFREAGIQIATHFAYDPQFLAFANTEYNTHYMNLAYTPHKALSLKICSEIFHRIPMNKDYGAYPENSRFEGFSIDYAQDLAVLNVEDKYFHTNTTAMLPQNPSKLAHLAGIGQSPVVQYDGTGAYFLDKLESGVWRLEVMPDVLITQNPYGRNSLAKKIAVIRWNQNRMEIKLDDLGPDFTLKPLNTGNTHQPTVVNGQFMVAPGAYLLVKSGVKTTWKATDVWQNIRLNEFHAPAASVDKTHLVHQQAAMTVADAPLHIEAQVISPDPSVVVQLQVTSGSSWKLINMERKSGFNYVAEIPREQLTPGFLTYFIYVKSGDQTQTFPAGKPGLPYDWDFYDRTPYRVRVIGKTQPVYLFDAQEDWDELSLTRWSGDSKLLPTDQLNESEFQIKINQLFQPDNENLNGAVVHDYTVKHYLNAKINHLRGQLSGKQTLVIKARSLDAGPKPVQIALVTKDGSAYGKTIELSPEMKEYEISIKDLVPVKTVTMPRPYPTFLPYFFANDNAGSIKLEDIEGLQISIGPGLLEAKLAEQHGVGVVKIWIK